MSGKDKGRKAWLALAALLVLVALGLGIDITWRVARYALNMDGMTRDWCAGVATGATPWLWWLTIRNFIRVRRLLREEARLLP